MPLLTAGSYYLDPLDRVHGPMTMSNGMGHVIFRDQDGCHYASNGKALHASVPCDLDLLTECDRHANPRREDNGKCTVCDGRGKVFRSNDDCKGWLGCEKCRGLGVQAISPTPWFLNLKGIQPAGDDVLVDVEFAGPQRDTGRASRWDWKVGGITAYRLHVAEAKGVEGSGSPSLTGIEHDVTGCEFTQYRRKQIAELRPYMPGESMDGVSVSAPDRAAGSPKPGDMIARNPKNHADVWLVAARYFADNFEPTTAASDPVPVGAGDVVTPRTPTESAPYEMFEHLAWLHIYGQEDNHMPARIIGTPVGLAKLANALAEAVLNGKSEMKDAFAKDGEGYSVEIERTNHTGFDYTALPYIDAMLAARKEGE